MLRGTSSPYFIDDILDILDDVRTTNTNSNNVPPSPYTRNCSNVTPYETPYPQTMQRSTYSPSVSQKPNINNNNNNTTMAKTIYSINFFIVVLGLAFSIINAIYLSSIDSHCSGYNEPERKFLFSASIIIGMFFALLLISSIWSLSKAF